MKTEHQLRLVDYAVVTYGSHERDYCLTNPDEVDELNALLQTLIESKTNFSVSFSKRAER